MDGGVGFGAVKVWESGGKTKEQGGSLVMDDSVLLRELPLLLPSHKHQILNRPREPKQRGKQIREKTLVV